jgi:transposase
LYVQSPDKSVDPNPPHLRTADVPVDNTLFYSFHNNYKMPRITSRNEYSPHKRTRIALKYRTGRSRRRIAFEEGVPSGSVSGVASRYGQQTSARSQPRVGRPKIISDRDKNHIFRILRQKPFISNQDLILFSGTSCSVRTLTRYLRAEGIQHYRALRRPKLTPEYAEKRLKFAQELLQRPELWWRLFIFSDEVSIARGDGERTKWVFCRKVGSMLISRPVAPTATKPPLIVARARDWNRTMSKVETSRHVILKCFGPELV